VRVCGYICENSIKMKMKKVSTLCLAFVCSLTSLSAFAQTATEGSMEIAKAAQPCAIINFNNMSPELLENTLKQIFSDSKLGDGDKSKGVRVFKGTVWPEISTDKLDYYFRVDGKKNASTVYMASSKGYTNFVTKTSDSATFARMLNFLNDLQRAATKYQLGEDIKAAEDDTKKEEKAYGRTVSEGKDLQAELEKIQKQIEENKQAQAKKMAEWEAAKKKLEELQAKFK
jgi:hypothetical protein